MTPYFTKALLEWNTQSNNRPMPWKGEKDPYKIWLSEIILQQTRVEQGWAYYEKILAAYPRIQDLANTKEERLFKLWEGLGYYTRCKNLLFTAKFIVKEYGGVFPASYEKLLALKGIGPYTAAAIASFAYNLPYAVVDGNVFRVFSRFYGIEIPIDTKEGISKFNAVANENLSKPFAGLYNQALMDFGATVCKPVSPNCSSCVMQKKCSAFNSNKVNLLPIKLKSIQKKKRIFDFYCFSYEGKWLVQKRAGGDIWENLYQFYLVEQEKQQKIDTTTLVPFLKQQLNISIKNCAVDKLVVSEQFKQQLTHQTIHARFIVLPLLKKPAIFEEALWVTKQQLKKLPFPKIANLFLEKSL